MFDICGIGNAGIDIIGQVDDAFLDRWHFPKGICTYLSLKDADALERDLQDPLYIPGGCAANTCAAINALGGKSAFIGRVAQDPIGERFLKDMTTRGIRYIGQPDTARGVGSTRIFCLTTPDTERTFAAYYGVQEDLSVADLDDVAIAQSKFLFLDGYALNSRHGGETFLAAAERAKKSDTACVFAPNDLSVLNKHAAIVEKLMACSDIMVCNAQEALHITKRPSLSEAIQDLQTRFTCGAVTIGDQGALVFDKASSFVSPAAFPPAPVLDTNGAGDHFAGGFLYGLSQGFPLEKAARLGNLCAASIITHFGARPIYDYRLFLKTL